MPEFEDMLQGSRSRHPSSQGPRRPLKDDDSALDQLVETDAKHPLTLAQLYRRARQRGLIQPHAKYH